MNLKSTFFITLAIACPFVGFADDHTAADKDKKMKASMTAEKKDRASFEKMVDFSSSIYASIAKGAHGEVPSKVLDNAKCIAVLPNVMTGALIIGGTHGDGLASCKDQNSNWSQPAPITLNQGSIGIQAGAKSTDLVLFFQNNDAVKALKRGSLELGSDVSAVAGNYDSKVDTSSAAVVVFARTEGLFAGASVNGSQIMNNQDDIISYYGKKADYSALLDNKEMPDNSGYTQKLTNLFPK